jgi:hypothetical protein
VREVLATGVCAPGAYTSLTQWILQVGDTALIPAGRTTNVVRRDDDGTWRYAISLLDL